MISKPKFVQLEVGDWSKDGHNQSDKYMAILDSNEKVSPADIKYGILEMKSQHIDEIYNNGVNACGLDITKYCEEYEDSSIPLDFAKALVNKLQVELEFDVNSEMWLNADGKFSISDIDFVKAFIAIFNQNTEGYKLELIEGMPNVHIGGYGLYY